MGGGGGIPAPNLIDYPRFWLESVLFGFSKGILISKKRGILLKIRVFCCNWHTSAQFQIKNK
jgi:hypothetical protein